MPKYPYTALPGEIGPVFKPLIRVILNYKKTHKITPSIIALIDSGADVCFCSKKVGNWLGIQYKNKKVRTFMAANSTKFKTWQERITLHVAETSYTCPFFFSDVLPAETPIILGQLGFFDKFKITFNAPHKTIEIK